MKPVEVYIVTLEVETFWSKFDFKILSRDILTKNS